MRHIKRFTRGTWAALALASVAAIGLDACGGGSGYSNSPNCPVIITDFSPTSGRVGDTVIIMGETLGGTQAHVGFSGAIADPLAGSSDTTVTVNVPLGAQTDHITVDNPAHPECQGSSDSTFSVIQ